MVNVVPRNDVREHLQNSECWCNPKIEFWDENGNYENGPLIIHNSADWREAAEQLIGEGLGTHKMWDVYEV